jgi:hypothetical protein
MSYATAQMDSCRVRIGECYIFGAVMGPSNQVFLVGTTWKWQTVVRFDLASTHTCSPVAIFGHFKLPPNQLDNMIFH